MLWLRSTEQSEVASMLHVERVLFGGGREGVAAILIGNDVEEIVAIARIGKGHTDRIAL